MKNILHGHINITKIIILTLCFLLAGSLLSANGVTEEVDYEEYPSLVELSYDTNSFQESLQTIQVLRSLYNNQKQANFKRNEVAVFFSTGNSSSTAARYLERTEGTDRLYYNIYDTSSSHNLLIDPSSYTAGSGDYLSFLFPRIKTRDLLTEQRIEESFLIEIPGSQFVHSGIYTDTITMSLYSIDNGTFYDTVNMTISVTVNDVLGLSIGAVDSLYDANADSYTMNFEVLETGETLSAFAVALSNTYYSIYVSSTNGGALKHSRVETYVPYTLFVDDVQISISDSQFIEVLSNQPPTDGDGNPHEISVVIGNVEWIPSGDYEENIIFEIVSN